MKRILLKAAACVLCVVCGAAMLLAILLNYEYEDTPATIVTTYTQHGFLTGGSWTVYDTPKGRIIERGIWGNPGDKLTIQTKKH